MAEKLYSIKNRSAGMVVYTIPELNIRREFTAGEVKKIPKDEIMALAYRSGGRELMADYLMLDESMTGEVGIHTEPEYKMTEQEVQDLLINGSIDEFWDVLNFAPVGVIDLIKQYAVSLPLRDLNKTDALKQKTGFDVNQALVHLEDEREVSNNEPAPKRRVTKKEDAAPKRRVKVVEE